MKDLWLFIGIIVFIFVVWVAMGGPSHPISFAGPFVTPLAPGVASTTGSGGFYLSRAATSTSVRETQSGLYRVQQDVVNLEKAVVSATRFGDPSPYKGLVTIRHSVGALSNDDPDKEYLTISTSYNVPYSGIDISGWRVESEAAGHSFQIPEGVNLPHSAIVNQTAPIVLGPGQTAIVVVGDSPLGMSFRENMCTGYFDQFQDFSPPISHLCPLPSADFDRFFIGNEHSLDACEAYIKTVPRCTIPLNEPADLSDDCYSFINTYLNYNGCVMAHAGDHNFYGNTWRIYAGKDDEFFTHDHDTIKLLDADGLTVDLLSY